MKNILMNCYYDEMSVNEAIDFIERCYGIKPTDKQLKNAKELIKKTTNKDWD